MRKYAAGEHLAQLICSTSPAAVPFFLVPSILLRTTSELQHLQSTRRKHVSVRHLATASAHARDSSHEAVETAEKERLARRAMSQPNKQAWINILEQYLPPYLRRSGSQEVDEAFVDTRKPVPVKDLYIWLAEARKVKEPKGDVLTHLAVEEGRHDAVVWLVEEVLREHMEIPISNQSRNRQLLGWPDQPFALLDDITRSSKATQDIFNSTGFAGSSLDPPTDHEGRDAAHECIGEIWRSIGSMVLQGADRAPASAESKSVMTCVRRLLAHLHHVGAIPSSIYNYAPAKDPSVLQRPPTIHYWSLRIMTAISDASWTSLNANAQQNRIVPPGLPSSDSSHVLSLPSAEMSSIMPEVEPQIWLDFVLWCCVEGGWITEAAEIVYQMWIRRGEGRQYSVIDFDALSEQHAPKLPWSARIKASIRRSRMRETVGGGTFGSYSDRIDFLKPPERTVSSEVVAAIVDGLVNTASPDPSLFGNRHSVVEKYISVCKIMLGRKQLGLGSNSWDSIVLRMFESVSTDPKIPHTFLEPIISWSPPLFQEPFAGNSAYQSDSPAQMYVADPSAVNLGLLYRLLSDLALKGDLRGALRIFRRLQGIVDTNRRISLEYFSAMLAPVLQQDGEDAVVRNGDTQEAPGLHLQLPPHIIAPFLDLITDAKEFELGSWLLHSEDIDGCIIPPSMYSDAVLQPSLIRFASAANDEKLLDSVTQRLQAPIPEAVLRALLHHQVYYARWDAVREILELSRDSGGLVWDPTDVTALASAVLKAERTPAIVLSKDLKAQSFGALLCDVLRGEYNTAHDPSRPRDLSETRMLNQLARIIASVPSKLSEDLTPFCSREYSKLSASCTIPTKAFNMLLESVVDLCGAPQGKKLCEMWCSLSDSDTARPRSRVGNGEAEQVVRPNIQTFYTVLRPLAQAIDTDKPQSDFGIHQSNDVAGNTAPGKKQASNEMGDSQYRSDLDEKERAIVDWGIANCMKLGVRWKDIKQDLPSLSAFGPNTTSALTSHDAIVEKTVQSEAGQAVIHESDAASRNNRDAHHVSTKPSEN